MCSERITRHSETGQQVLVGGIGVMNMMLVSVTERTREIGVRKALGARGDIIGQFLVEAVALTGVGGTVGILISLVITLIHRQAGAVAAVGGAGGAGTGFSVSVAVGIFFGVWPAASASRAFAVNLTRVAVPD